MRIRTARESVGMSREQFAAKVPMSASFLADVEGGTKGLSLEKFYRIAKVLDVSADYLLCRSFNQDNAQLERSIILEKINESIIDCDTENLRIIADIVRQTAYIAKGKKEELTRSR
ncbi:MAG: helix-turn-helix transcriptional regulator [Bacillota bacterium]|nr:helix-turn-helix transcriptional regulator [Bacillota bacterium]